MSPKKDKIVSPFDLHLLRERIFRKADSKDVVSILKNFDVNSSDIDHYVKSESNRKIMNAHF